MYKFFNVGLIILLGITMCACTDTKSNRVDEALAKKQKEEEKLKKRIKKDKTKPVITCSDENPTFEANKTIDFDRLLLSLKAVDNVDGDISKKIKQIKSNIVQHQEGDYHIEYSVKDSAGNKGTYSLPVKIISKYNPMEKNRLNSVSKAFFTVSANKNLTDLYFPNIISTESGNMILVEYGGDDNRGEYQYGRIVYYSEDGHLEELSEYASYPNDFQGQKYEYDEENVKDFIKYYHLD